MADRVTRAYRDRVARVHAEIARRLDALYGDRIDADAIATSFEGFIDDAEPLIAAGQSTVAHLAEAFLQSRAARAGVELALDDRIEEIVGTTRDGTDLRTGMAAIGPMVLGSIGGGKSLEEALEYGRYLSERFADAELTGTTDRVQEDPTVRDRITGWLGEVEGEACDPCSENEGEHEADWEPYRHPGCACLVTPIFGAAA